MTTLRASTVAGVRTCCVGTHSKDSLGAPLASRRTSDTSASCLMYLRLRSFACGVGEHFVGPHSSGIDLSEPSILALSIPTCGCFLAHILCGVVVALLCCLGDIVHRRPFQLWLRPEQLSLPLHFTLCRLSCCPAWSDDRRVSSDVSERCSRMHVAKREGHSMWCR